jgi:hypothetical protein
MKQIAKLSTAALLVSGLGAGFAAAAQAQQLPSAGDAIQNFQNKCSAVKTNDDLKGCFQSYALAQIAVAQDIDVSLNALRPDHSKVLDFMAKRKTVLDSGVCQAGGLAAFILGAPQDAVSADNLNAMSRNFAADAGCDKAISAAFTDAVPEAKSAMANYNALQKAIAGIAAQYKR